MPSTDLLARRRRPRAGAKCPDKFNSSRRRQTLQHHIYCHLSAKGKLVFPSYDDHLNIINMIDIIITVNINSKRWIIFTEAAPQQHLHMFCLKHCGQVSQVINIIIIKQTINIITQIRLFTRRMQGIQKDENFRINLTMTIPIVLCKFLPKTFERM